ncbi:MAG: micrococcal nuclease [Actinomycetota bacterium]|nr:micrococcal nuclease [Actinomycetota bacterium]
MARPGLGGVLALALLAACGAPSVLERSAGETAVAPPAAVEVEAVVASITDGDTFRAQQDSGATVPIRLIGIDTPELRGLEGVQCYAAEASAFLGQLIPVGSRVRLVYDVDHQDRYGRDLAYVYRGGDGLFVNLELARQGYAVQATFPPNVAHEAALRDAVRDARESRRGLWSAC